MKLHELIACRRRHQARPTARAAARFRQRQDRRHAVTRASGPVPAAVSARALKAARCLWQRRLPKRGFHNIFGTTYAPVNVSASGEV